MSVNMKFNLQSVMKPLIQIHHHSLLSSINHLFFLFFPSALTTKWTSFGSKTITRALSQIGLPSASVPVKVCQVFDASLPAPPQHIPRTPSRLMEMLAGYRCWPVVPLFEMCSLCFSLEGNGDRLISPDAHSPGKKEKKGKRRGWRGSRLHWAPFLQSWNPHWKKKKKSISRICFIWN